MKLHQYMKEFDLKIKKSKSEMIELYHKEDNDDIYHTKREILDLFVGNQYRFETEASNLYEDDETAVSDFLEFLQHFYPQRKERGSLFLQNFMIDVYTFLWIFGQEEIIKKTDNKLTLEALETIYKYYKIGEYNA